MRWYVNRYSYLVFSAIALVAAGLLGRRFGGAASLVSTLGVGGALAAAQLALRGRSSTQDWAEVQQQTHAGRPTLLFVYSDT